MLTSLTTNVLYKYAWMGIGWGNLIIFGLPGLVWPVSLAGRPGFNGFYVQWQQYMTFYTGVSLNLIVVGLLFASYLTYESDASLDQSTILNEAITYLVVSIVTSVPLYTENSSF